MQKVQISIRIRSMLRILQINPTETTEESDTCPLIENMILPLPRIFMVLGDMEVAFVPSPSLGPWRARDLIVWCGLSCLVDLNSDLYCLCSSLHGPDTFWARGLSWINKETTTTTTLIGFYVSAIMYAPGHHWPNMSKTQPLDLDHSSSERTGVV